MRTEVRPPFKFGITIFMKIVTKIVLAISLLWQTSCAFISMEDYYRPDDPGEFGHLASIDCCGGSGPEAVLVFDAPKGVQFTMIMWNGEAGNKHRMIKGKKGRGTFGMLGIYAPPGVTVNFESDIVILEALGKEKKHTERKRTTQHVRNGLICAYTSTLHATKMTTII